jgi:hypothetical protein
MMDVLDVSKEIQRYIKALRDAQNEITKQAGIKARAMRGLKRNMAITTVRLRNGEEMEVGGEKIQSPPATLMKTIAEGICAEDFLQYDVAEADYKEIVTRVETIRAILCGYQSLYKHLDTTTKFD